MSHQPDKLFRQKLENYQRPAPQDAWSRIEKGRSKKNNTVLWLRIAASLFLVAVASIITVTVLKNENNSIITSKDIKAQQPVPDVQNAQEQTADKSEITIPQKTLKEPNQITHRHDVKKDRSPVALTTKESESVKEIKIEPEIISEKEAYVDTSSPVSSQQEIVNAENDKGFKLIIEAEEVNQKYLKKESLAKATSREDNPSGIKKLLDKAQDLKNNQNPLGDLRQMKNEIFALNFQENKKLEQNK